MSGVKKNVAYYAEKFYHGFMATKSPSALLQVRIREVDLLDLRRLAAMDSQTLAEYVRRQLRIPDPPRGGARPGAGAKHNVALR